MCGGLRKVARSLVCGPARCKAAAKGERAVARRQIGARRRKWLDELTSVVVGVLIALGLGAVAGEIGWQIEVMNARAALASELGELIGQGEERDRINACVERRLDQIADVVAAAETSGRLPPLAALEAPPWRTWSRGVWASTLSAQTASHFDRDLLDNYSGAYEFADLIADNGRRELEAWTAISALSGPGRAFSQAEAVALRGAIANARLANRLITGGGLRLKQVVIAFDLRYDLASASDYNQRPASAYPICRPVAAGAGTRYGEAPMQGLVDRVKADPIVRRR